MVGGYLEKKDWDEIKPRMNSVIDDTFSCWIATRLNGVSASLACDGNVDVNLIKKLDALEEKIVNNKDSK